MSFTHGTRTPEELLNARDKTQAHLREFEIEARRWLVESVVQHNEPRR